MNKIIIGFDGPDNVGKGTQIKKVRKYFSNTLFIIIDTDNPLGNSNEEKIEYGKKNEREYFKTRKILLENNISQINDRTHFSEYAYRIFRESDEIEDILNLEKEFIDIKNNFLIFTFIDKVENIIARDDGESSYDVDDKKNIEELINRFNFISKKSIFDNYIINIENKDENDVFEIIKEKIKQKFSI